MLDRDLRLVVAELAAQIEQLQGRLAESETENDQWQKKLAEVWAEVARLRAEAGNNQPPLQDATERHTGAGR